MANFLANIIFQLIAAVIGHKLPIHIKCTLMNVLLGASFIFLPFVAHNLGSHTPWILYGLVFIVGCFNAILQASVFGLGGMLPFKYTIAIMGGNGVAGLLIGIARMICLFAFGENQDKVWLGTLIYFIIALIIVLTGVVGFFFIQSNSTMKKYMANSKATVASESYISIWNKISVEAIIVFITFVLTFLVFPAVALFEPLPRWSDRTELDTDWNLAFMGFIFNLFDTIGRFLPILFKGVSKDRLYMVLLSRFVFLITFGLLFMYPCSKTSGAGYYLISLLNMALFSFTNGYSSSLAMGYGPSNVSDENKSIAGNMMSFHLIFGIFIGTMGGKGINRMFKYFIRQK